MPKTLPADRDPVVDGTKQLSDSPVFTSPNKMKLGVFSTNLSGAGAGISTLKGAPEIASWDEQVYYAKTADQVGLEVLVPASRWKGFGGPSGYWDRTYDTWTWGAALASVTRQIQIFTTAAVPLYHPVMAAKMGATLDHVTGGRWGLNIVPGWFGEEFEQFGLELGDRGDRYKMATEWVTLLYRLWSEHKEIDFEGDFFSTKGAVSEPKPIQAPRPLIMNAGQSEEGQEFAVTYADMIFTGITKPDVLTKNIENIRAQATAKGRMVSIWSNLDIVCKDTEQEARDLAEQWVEYGDDVAVNKFVNIIMGGDSASQLHLKADPAVSQSLKLSGGNLTVIGTPEQIVSEFQRLSDLGVDGLTMTWKQYPEGLDQFLEKVHPLMVEAGLRVKPEEV